MRAPPRSIVATLVLVGAAGGGGAAEPSWQLVNPLPVEVDLHDVAFGNGLYVAVGDHGLIMTSGDGVVWERQACPTDACLRGVVWHGPLWAAVGVAGTVVTSPDGSHWLERGPVAEHDLEAVASGSSGLVAVGVAGTVVTSPEGVRWRAGDMGVVAGLNDVAWVGEEYLAVGEGGTLRTSADGVEWAAEDPGTTGDLEAVASDGDAVIAVGDGWVSRRGAGAPWDGWREGTLSGARDVAWCGDRFVVVGDRGRWVVSPHGATWSEIGPTQRPWLGAVACGGPGLVAVGQGGTTAFGHHAEAWTVTSSVTTWAFERVTMEGGRSVALASLSSRADVQPWSGKGFPPVNYQALWYSDDGVQWQRSTQLGNGLVGLAAGAGRFVVLGGSWYMQGGSIIVSEDGIDWTTGWGEPGSWFLEALTWDGDRFVAAGWLGVLTSPDGVTWQAHEPGYEDLCYVATGVASDGRRIVVSSWGCVASAAYAGAPWTRTWLGYGVDLNAVVWGAGTFAAVGLQGAVFTSADGLQWQRQASGTEGDLWDVAWTGDRFVAVGLDGLILASDDGRRWRRGASGLHGDLLAVTSRPEGLLAVGEAGLIQRQVTGEQTLPPVAAFAWRPVAPRIGMAVRLMDRSSGAPTRWTWQLGAGVTAEGPVVTHVWSEPGAYPVSLRAVLRPPGGWPSTLTSLPHGHRGSGKPSPTVTASTWWWASAGSPPAPTAVAGPCTSLPAPSSRPWRGAVSTSLPWAVPSRGSAPTVPTGLPASGPGPACTTWYGPVTAGWRWAATAWWRAAPTGCSGPAARSARGGCRPWCGRARVWSRSAATPC